MKNFLKNQREFLAIGLFLVLVFLLWYFAVTPLLGKIVEIKNQIEEGSLRQEIRRQQLSELPKISQQYAKVENQKEKIAVLLTDDRTITLIERLEELAKNSNNAITIKVVDEIQKSKNTNLTAKSKVEDAIISALPSKNYLKLDITLKGKYAGLLEFMTKLETFEYYGDIISISITNSVTVNQTSKLISSENLNPFVAGSKSAPVSNVKIQNNEELESLLEVVFYKK